MTFAVVAPARRSGGTELGLQRVDRAIYCVAGLHLVPNRIHYATRLAPARSNYGA